MLVTVLEFKFFTFSTSHGMVTNFVCEERNSFLVGEIHMVETLLNYFENGKSFTDYIFLSVENIKKIFLKKYHTITSEQTNSIHLNTTQFY